MFQFKDSSTYTYKMGFFESKKFTCFVLILCVFGCLSNVESRQTRTPARLLAKQTGATQFEEERYEAHTDCNEHKHHLKKRASDEDVDYEVYQGVVGRPGIDFPIYPRIPKTSFSCRSFGNGYFADMDTDCQVFHICEEGRKISFLCPNGTIFQQSELTCDWWFKVNCLGSPGYYAESAEILNKQRLHRVRPSVPVQGFNIVGGGLNIKPKIPNAQTRSRQSNKPERRIDSSEQQPSVETIDFDDISGEKSTKEQSKKVISNIENNDNSNDNESQITAETASFVSERSRNNYGYEKPSESKSRGQNPSVDLSHAARNSESNKDRNGQRKSYVNPPSTNTESSDRARSGQRGQQRFKEESKPPAESNERLRKDGVKSNNGARRETTGKLQDHVEIVDVAPRSNNRKEEILVEPEVKPEFYNDHLRTTEKTHGTTHHHNSGTYTTARKLDTSRTTPYYTPTVPSVVKTKSTEGKSYYVKGKGTGNVIATTPSPNRLNGNIGISNFFLESSGPPKTTSNVETNTLSTTLRPFIIGMRHHHDGDSSPAEIHRLTIGSNRPLKIDDLPVKKLNEKPESREFLTTTTPASTGPTYLPKSANAPKGSSDAGGSDLLLFAPNPVSDESVSRNLNEMLKTMNALKSKLSDAEEIKGTGPARNGLDIPPSSGPDVLISLAKYFAAEQGGSNVNSVTNKDKVKGNDKQSGSKSSGTTSTTPSVTVKQDNIKASLLSERTVDRYTSLFGLNEDVRGKVSKGSAGNEEKKGSFGIKDTHTSFPQIGTTDTTIRELARKPETRIIAKEFSNALSKYLEDPKSFRQQLEAIRPTEPPSDSLRSITPNFTPITATEKALFRSGTAATYLPTKPTPSSKFTTSHTNIAAEINSKFDSSTQLPDLTSTTEVIETTTYKPAFNAFAHKHKINLSSELSAPRHDSGEGEEILHREHTQSFVKPHNELTSSQNTAKKTGKASGAYISAVKPTENPWNSISQTDFLDPLTINDGLMKETKPTTSSPFTYLAKETTTQRATQTHNNFRQSPSKSRYEFSSAEVTTQRSTHHRLKDSDSWRDILISYDLPLDTLPSSNGLQRIANRLFGGLNESEALHLKNVMQQAEHNRQVLRLLLLLIQTCDDQNGRALERSRKHLLNALIDMDSKIGNVQKSKSSHQKTAGGATATTIKQNNNAVGTSTLSYPHTTTELPGGITTTSGSYEETTKFEIRVEDPDEDQISTASTISATNSSTSSDRRALELLKSLYSLASKFTSRR